MGPAEILSLLNDVEARFPVTEWRLGDLAIWPIIRIHIAFELNRRAPIRRQPSNPISRLLYHARSTERLLGRRRAHRQALRRDPDRDAEPEGEVDAILLTMSTARRCQIEDRYFDIFSDPLIDQLEANGRRAHVMEFSPEGEYRLPRYRASQLVQPALDRIRLRAELAARLRRHRVAGSDTLRELLEGYLPRQNGGCRISPGTIHSIALKTEAMASFFGDILRRSRPRVGLNYGWYDREGMAFGLACRRCHIPSVDVQHGAQGASHTSYAAWSAVPKGGYALLPSVFWTWDQAAASTIDGWAESTAGAHRTLVGGNPFADPFRDDQSELAVYFDAQSAELLDASGPVGARVLLALQDELTPDMLALIAASPPDWRWWVRLHPARVAKRGVVEAELRRVRPQGIRVERPTTLPLQALLRHADVLVTPYSSSVLDAADMGVFSVVLDPVGQVAYKNQIDTGWARTGFNVEDALESIAAQAALTGQRRREGTPADRDRGRPARDWLLDVTESGSRAG